jgi:hypothetical protein
VDALDLAALRLVRGDRADRDPRGRDALQRGEPPLGPLWVPGNGVQIRIGVRNYSENHGTDR